MTVREFLNQVDITDTTSSESKKIATIFSANNKKGKETLKSGKAITEFFK